MAKWIAALIILFPVTVHQLDFRSRFSGGLSLHLQRTSPAYAALEDSRDEFAETADLSNNLQLAVKLKAGKQRITTAMSLVQAPLVALNTMHIHRSFVTRPPLQAGVALHTELPKTGLLPLDERKHILEQYYEREDWSAPTVGERAKELVAQEVEINPPNVDAKLIIGSVSNAPIIVAKPGVDISGLLKGTPHPAVIASAAPPPISTANAFRNTPTPAVSTMTERRDVASGLSVAQMPMSENDPHLLRGELQIRDGLAFMGQQTYFTLHRVSDGRVFESGRVWIEEARFEIYVKEQRGQLIAELHGNGGQTLGRGTVDLDDTLGFGEPLRIELTPVSTGAAARVLSGYSEGTRAIVVKNAVVAFDQNSIPRPANSDGIHTDENRSTRSSYVLQAQAAAHWPTLAIGTEGVQQDVRLYPEALMKSLLDLTAQGTSRKRAEMNGVVWGRIVNNGKPVAGVEVELAGDYTPIYFNKFLPDPSRTSTDANGGFAFVNVRPGVQALRVKYNDKYYPAQIFPAEMRHLSYVEIHLEANRSVNVALQDAFDVGRRMSAHVRFVGIDDEVSVQDEQKVTYPAGPQTMMLEADAGSDYELSRAQVLKDSSHVTVPLIRRDWLRAMVDIKQVTLLPNHGTVVGFVSDQPFQVELTDATAGTPEVIYFDAIGQLVEGGSGPAGGGFILFNAPLGLQTLLVKPLTSQQVFSQTFVAEPEFVHVFKYSFGESY